MKLNLLYTLVALFTITCLYTASAQIKAVTETGEEVVLLENGTWSYVDEDLNKETDIQLNAIKFTKDKKATFLLKSKVNGTGVWLNTKDWNFNKAVNNEDAEYELNYKKGDIYAMIITEEVAMPLESLKSIALETAQEAAPDLRLVNEEYRMVNGHKVLHMEMSGTTQGIKFTYYSYYFTNDNGATQFAVFSSDKLVKKYKDEIEKLVNGFVVVEE